MAVLVNDKILAAFDRALSTYASSVRLRLVHPGLSEEEVRQRFAAAGLRPSVEALTWWRYFDRGPSDLEHPHYDVLPDFEFVPVASSVEIYRRERSFAMENAAGFDPPLDADAGWGAQWIPIFFIGTGGNVVLDCAGPDGAPSPVRAVYPDEVFSDSHAQVFAPSLGELLARATRWMEQGSCRFEPERRLWWPSKAWSGRPLAERFRLPG